MYCCHVKFGISHICSVNTFSTLKSLPLTGGTFMLVLVTVTIFFFFIFYFFNVGEYSEKGGVLLTEM